MFEIFCKYVNNIKVFVILSESYSIECKIEICQVDVFRTTSLLLDASLIKKKVHVQKKVYSRLGDFRVIPLLAP